MSYETDNWPIVRARWFTKSNGRRTVRVIVIHSMEAPEKGSTAESVAKYFANLPPTRQASAHVCIDNDSVVQCVSDNDVAYAAPGANHDGIQIELAGYARQTTKEWLDPFGVSMLNRAADVVAQYCIKYNIPVRKLTNVELASGGRGIIGHHQASEVYKKSTHTDPGAGFPWRYFICAVETFHRERLKAA